MNDAGTTAVVFPGQGSQAPGMATPWQGHPAFDLWQQADDILGWKVSRLGVEAQADELREPRSCQLALFVHHAVLLEAWRETAPPPVAAAGHSLGEYDALLAAGVLSFADALRLVDARARATQAAAEQRPGTMAACLGHDVGAVTEACAQAGAYVANDNAPGQIVIAGDVAALDRVADILAGQRGKVKRLEVGAAYHSPSMELAVEPFSAALSEAAFADGALPVVANVDARPHRRAAEWEDLLRRQLTAPVRWRESVATLRSTGVEEVVELAATPVLSGMVKRIDPTISRRAIVRPEDL